MTPTELWIPLILYLWVKSFNPVYSNSLCCSHPPQVRARCALLPERLTPTVIAVAGEDTLPLLIG